MCRMSLMSNYLRRLHTQNTAEAAAGLQPIAASVSVCVIAKNGALMLSACTKQPRMHTCLRKVFFEAGLSIGFSGWSGLMVEYRARNREVAGSTHTRSTASNLEQVANLLCAQANSASYPQPDVK